MPSIRRITRIGQRLSSNVVHFGAIFVGTYLLALLTFHILDLQEIISYHLESESSLVEKFILVLVSELGCEKDWWVTKMAGVALVAVYGTVVTAAISFSAVFQILCLLFIMWKKWGTIQSFLTKFWGEVSHLGVF